MDGVKGLVWMPISHLYIFVIIRMNEIWVYAFEVLNVWHSNNIQASYYSWINEKLVIIIPNNDKKLNQMYR